MFLEPAGNYNNISKKLRDELQKKVEGFGKIVRYRFDISNPNPDPTFHNGKILWPHLYTLDPAVFNIIDNYEDQSGVSKSKRIGLVEGLDDKGFPNRFRKVKIWDRQKGVLTLELEKPEDFDYAMFLEMHPKLTGGKFADASKRQIITRIDEQAAATDARQARAARSKARKVAEEMSDKGVIEFADAMMWDSSQDKIVLRNQIEELAETNPEFFNDLVEGKSMEHRALVQQALNKKIISFDPADNSMRYTSNRQTIAVLGTASDKNEVEKMADWLMGGGKKEEEVHKKLKSLVEGKAVEA